MVTNIVTTLQTKVADKGDQKQRHFAGCRQMYQKLILTTAKISLVIGSVSDNKGLSTAAADTKKRTSEIRNTLVH